ncbi:hypothetical protein M2103_000075 [Ereboglobus sp. PH5-5]|nr:hypothetical protein [Ereboglobus sp. PH5-5]
MTHKYAHKPRSFPVKTSLKGSQRGLANTQGTANAAFSHKKTPADVSGGGFNLVDPIRIELTTSSMPLRRSAN